MLELFDWDPEPMEFLEVQYEEYIDRLFASLQDDDEFIESETGQLFCGCETCYVRETFAFLMPRFIDLYVKGHITLQHPNKEEGDGVQLVQGRRDMEQGSAGNGGGQ